MLSHQKCLEYAWACTKLFGAKVDLVFTEDGDGLYLIDGDKGVCVPIKDMQEVFEESGFTGIVRLMKLYVQVLRNTYEEETE